jgi:hypothetical protein
MRATPITVEDQRREILSAIVAAWRKEAELEMFVERSPLVRVEFTE